MKSDELIAHIKSLGKLVNFDMLSLTVKKLKELINKKADIKHTHSASDVSDTENKQFVNSEQKKLIDKLIITGNGTKYLNDSGTYTEMAVFSQQDSEKISKITADGNGTLFLSDDGYYKSSLTDAESAKLNSIIIDGDGLSGLTNKGTYKKLITVLDDDTKTSTDKTYSSEYIQRKFDKETHINRKILDDITLERFTTWEEKTKKIILDGNGDRYLSDDGTYKIVNSDDIINDNISDALETTLSSSKINKVINDKISYSEASTKIILDQKQNAEIGKGLSTNDFTNEYRDKIAAITTTGKSDSFLAQDGFYYQIHDYGINNEVISDTATYSSSKIDEMINTGFKNVVLPSQNDAPTMWQKSYDNVLPGDVIEINTSVNYRIKKAMIQIFKFINGKEGVEKIVSSFGESDAKVYTHNPENVIFEFGGTNSVKIKDKYDLELSKNTDGFYQTPLIKKSEFVNLYDFSVEEAV